MAVRIGRVVMIGSHPIEFRIQVALHLRHHVTREDTQVAKLLTVFRRNDDPELMFIILTAFVKLIRIEKSFIAIIQNTFLAFTRSTVPLNVIEMMSLRIFSVSAHFDEMDFNNHASRKILF